jgi:DNA-binding beta-propeller fold protein YncE
MSTTNWPQPGGGILQPGGPAGGAGRQKWVKVAIVLLLLAGLAWVLLLGVQYFLTGRSITQLPGLPGLSGLFKQPAHYESSLYGVQRPLGVAVGADGNVYVTESDGERKAHVFNRAGQEVLSFAPPNTEIPSREPLYIAISPKNEIYVSDRFNRAIYIWAADGSLAGTYQPQSVPAEDWHPMGLAFDSAGNLYVTDVTPEKHRVMVFDKTGALKLQFGSQGSADGQFWYPNGIAVDGKGRIYVADGDNGRLQVFDAAGKHLFNISRGYATGDLAMPRGVAIDDQNHRLLVVDTSADTVKVYDISGDSPRFLSDFGESGSGDGQFRYPNGVALASGKIYVTDRENGRVQIWSYNP